MSNRGCLVAGAVIMSCCTASYATVVLEEHGPYNLGFDYRVEWTPAGPAITILAPSLPGEPYWFECYDDESPWPYRPATIAAITAAPGIGTVELQVRGDLDEGRFYGAYDVNVLQFREEQGVYATVKTLRIGGQLGSSMTSTHSSHA